MPRSTAISFCIITNGKRPEKLAQLLASIRSLSIPRHEIILVGSPPSHVDLSDANIQHMEAAAQKGLLGAMRNRAVQNAQHPIVVVCDDDLIFTPDFYAGVHSFGPDFDVQCVRLLNPDGTRYWDWASTKGPCGQHLLDYKDTHPFAYITGGLCIARKEVFERVRWDETLGFYKGEDVDFSRRIKEAGYRIAMNPDATVIHDDASYTQVENFVIKTDHESASISLPSGVVVEGAFPLSDVGFPLCRRFTIGVPQSAEGVKYLQIVLELLPLYLYFPGEFSLDVYYRSELWGRFTMDAMISSQKVVASLPVPDDVPPGDTISFHFIAPSAVVELIQLGVNQHRVLSGTLKKVLVDQSTSNEGVQLTFQKSPEGSPRKKYPVLHKSDLHIHAPFLDSSPEAAWSRCLLDALETPDHIISAEPYALDALYRQSSLSNQPRQHQWLNRLLNVRSSKIRVEAIPLYRLFEPRFFENQRIRYPDSEIIPLIDSLPTNRDSDSVQSLLTVPRIACVGSWVPKRLAEWGYQGEIIPLPLMDPREPEAPFAPVKPPLSTTTNIFARIPSEDPSSVIPVLRSFVKMAAGTPHLGLLISIAGWGDELRSVGQSIEAFFRQTPIPVETGERIFLCDEATPYSTLQSYLHWCDLLVHASPGFEHSSLLLDAALRGKVVVTANEGPHVEYLADDLLVPSVPVPYHLLARSQQSSLSLYPRVTSEGLTKVLTRLLSDSSYLKRSMDSTADLLRACTIEPPARLATMMLSLGQEGLPYGKTPPARTIETRDRSIKPSGLSSQQPGMIFEVPEESRCIGIDARTLLHEQNVERGIGHYTVHHTQTLAELCPHWKFYLFLELEQFSKPVEHLLALPNVEYRSFHDATFADLDVFHIPDPMSVMWAFDSPFLIAPQGIPQSALFHDFIPIILRNEHFDRWVRYNKIAYLSRLMQARNSNPLVLTNSKCTANDVEKYLNLPADRIVTVYAGLNSTPRSLTDREVQASLAKFDINRPYFLTVGGTEIHKNFACTFNAFQNAASQEDIQLVVAGSLSDPGKWQVKKYCDENGINNVVFPGYVDRNDLDALYASARALCFPSYYEGFGFPVLEAMALGCPVISSNVSCLPEVAGDAAILIDPTAPEEMTDAMLRLARDQSLRATLIEHGYRQAAKFSWQRTAMLTTDAWERLLWNKPVYPMRPEDTKDNNSFNEVQGAPLELLL